MKKSFNLHEPWVMFHIVVELPSGRSITLKEKGRTHYEALDRAHTNNISVQRDRTKYMLSTSL